MKTYILFWNPAISSYKLDDFQEKMSELEYNNLNWSVWEHEKASCGDRFFMVRCGEGKTGICMSGYFASDPYKGEDWSGKGRDVYYMDLDPEVMLHPDYCTILTTEKLCQSIPDFDWTGGSSGRLLDVGPAEQLEILWKGFLEANEEIFATRAVRQELDLSYYTSKNDKVQTIDISLTENGRVHGYNDPFDVEIEGDDVESVKKKITELIYQKTEKRPEIQIHFRYIEEEYQELYGKTIKLFLENKKEGDTYDKLYYDTEELMVYLLSKASLDSKTLRGQNFPEKIVDAVKSLERWPKEPFLWYVKRAVLNDIAKEIIEDRIREAIDISSLKSIDDATIMILNDNLAALHYLQSLNT